MSLRTIFAVFVVLIGLGAVIWFRLAPTDPSPPTIPAPQVVGRYEAIERGALIATPWVSDDRIYVAAVRDTGLQPTGAIHCLDRATLKPIWTFDDGGAMLHMFSSPVVADGRLYVGEGMHANFDCHLYCLDAVTGKKLWAYSAGSHIESTPVVRGDRVFFGAGDDGVICVNAANGERIWKLDAPAHVDTTPVLAGGVVYVGSGISRRIPAEPAVFALDAGTGRVLWRTKFDLPAWATPALSDGVLYVGLGNGQLLEVPRAPDKPRGAMVALDAKTGQQRWRFDECDAVFGTPSAGRERLFFGSRDGRFHCLDGATGGKIWSVDCGSPIVAGPTQAEVVVVATSAGLVIGIDWTIGKVKWVFDAAQYSGTKAILLSPPAVSLDIKDQRYSLYLPTELRSPAGSAATLLVLRP